MALTKISGNVVQQNNFTLSGVVTATSFTGDLTGNVTGTATTATNLADGANITTGTISNDRLPATITKNLTGDVTGNLTGNVTGNVTGTATTATNLADGANITTGTISNDRLPATITKNLTGDVTGNLTGNVSSSGANTLGSLTVTNDATVGGALTITGNLTVNGTTTTIDTVVTAVDSIAVDGDVTAGGNLNVTGVATATTFNGNLTGNVTGNVTGNLTGNLQSTASLAGISSSISDTAVDIFVYDTRKDSDGGAWRKRTQHTSWYNETLNTATRGSRREFPAVAVIVAETGSITIYDGDDPDLPMWMVFNSVFNKNTLLGYSTSFNSISITAVNGSISVASNSGSIYTGGYNQVNFINEILFRMRGDVKRQSLFSIDKRNNGFTDTESINTTSQVIVSGLANDVAMTVLPNAPIDSTTGLPVPTIAVATEGGVSVIKDDGTVVDSSSTATCESIAIHDDALFIGETTFQDELFVANNYAWLSDSFTVINYYSATTPAISTVNTNDVINGVAAISDVDIAIGMTATLTLLQQDKTIKANGLVSYITSDYNTGWMHGDIKGAFLSDTDATNVTGTELVTNGTFSNTNASSVSNWDNVSVGTGTISEGSGYASLNRVDGNNSGRIGQGMNLVTGKVYTVSFDLVSGSTSGVQLRQYNSSTQDISTVIVSFLIADGVGKKSQTFTSQSGYDGLMLIAIDDTSTVARVDNFSVRIADLDRSVNNKGLQVFGTINKSIVATGAELVAYSNWSTSNYLSQPYNPDLDVGTGDFSIAVWIRATSFDSYNTVFAQWRENQTSTEQFSLETVGSVLRFYVIKNGTYAYAGGNTTLSTNVWYHIVVKRIGGVIYMYVNAKQESTTLDYSGDLTARTDPTTVGVLWSATGQSGGATGPWKGYISLLRFSASAPSAEQIKKIYEDEKVLFQENAACTLHGSSDAVTALAYDDSTNLLYAGTSSGRSDFQGLRRINNTTTAVTTAISASNGLVAEQ